MRQRFLQFQTPHSVGGCLLLLVLCVLFAPFVLMFLVGFVLIRLLFGGGSPQRGSGRTTSTPPPPPPVWERDETFRQNVTEDAQSPRTDADGVVEPELEQPAKGHFRPSWAQSSKVIDVEEVKED